MNNEEYKQEPRVFHFEPFRLDVPNAQLWRGQELLRLTSKALAVLGYLERVAELIFVTRYGVFYLPNLNISKGFGIMRHALVSPYRVGRSHELSDVLLVSHRPRQCLYKCTNILGELKCALFKIIPFRACIFFGHSVFFRISNSEFRIFYLTTSSNIATRWIVQN